MKTLRKHCYVIKVVGRGLFAGALLPFVLFCMFWHLKCGRSKKLLPRAFVNTIIALCSITLTVSHTQITSNLHGGTNMDACGKTFIWLFVSTRSFELYDFNQIKKKLHRSFVHLKSCQELGSVRWAEVNFSIKKSRWNILAQRSRDQNAF